METEKKPVKLNLRSDEIEAILGKTPSWLMRAGITVICCFFTVLLVGSSFFRYPDVVSAQIRISSEYPSVALVTKTSGRLVDLAIKDKDSVVANQLIGVIESSCSVDDMMSLGTWINKNRQPDLINADDSIFIREQQLGEVMPYFLELKQALVSYAKFVSLNYHAKNKKFLEEQVLYMSKYIVHTESQIDLIKSDLELARTDYGRDSLLFNKHVLSPADIGQSKSIFLQKKISLEGNIASLANSNTQLSQLKRSLLEVELDYRKQQEDLLDNIRQKTEALRDRIEQWDKTYVLRSPYTGQVSYPAFWTINQYIKQGETFANVISSIEGLFVGKLELPILKSGKVKPGQKVQIKLDNYPYMEYGILKGVVRSISTVPSNNMYIVVVELPGGMKTSYGTELPFSPEITGTSDIITEDYNILQRIFFPLKSLMKNNGPSFLNE